MWHSVASRDDAGKADGSGGPDPSGVDDDDEDDEEEDDDDDDKKKTKGSLLLLPLLRRALHRKWSKTAVVGVLRERKACIIVISGEGKNDTLSYLLANGNWWVVSGASLWASQFDLTLLFSNPEFEPPPGPTPEPNPWGWGEKKGGKALSLVGATGRGRGSPLY